MTADVASSATGGNGGWRVLETGFGLGLNFLATWHAWRQWRAQCPTAAPLHFTAVEAWPVQADDIRRSVATLAELAPLAEVLAQRWVGLLPGTHRFNFDEGQVQLTLCIGPVQTLLAQLDTPVDSVFLTHPNANTDGEQWTPATLKAVARLCQPGTRLAAPTLAPPVQDALKQLGFVPDGGTRATAAGATASHGFGATYAPHWPLRRVVRTATPATDATPAQRQVVVIGGGLSGAAAAYSLAQRGYAVQVLDRSAHPAAGASGLPVGLVAPHTSPDDNVLSRLSRAGVRATLQRCQALLAPGTDWAHSGVLEHRVEGKRGLPAGDAWPEAGLAWSRPAPTETLAAASLPADTPALWHAQAGWLRPAQLVAAQLQHPNIEWRGGCEVARLERTAQGWRVWGADGTLYADSPCVVLAAAYDCLALLQRLGGDAKPVQVPLNPLRGQITWNPLPPDDLAAALPPFPVNGHGSFVSGTLGPDGRPGWFMGSTFERGATQGRLKPEDQEANLTRLQRLLPAVAQALGPEFGAAQAWAAVRCTVPDRLPLVGALDAEQLPGLLLCAGMGARGLTLSVLCGEVLAAELTGEPWPVDKKLALALAAQRWRR